MPIKDSNTSTMNKNKETIKKVSAKVHEELLNTSHLFIDETVATLTRMQKITGKVIKKSEPILEKQIEITFDAVEALTNQATKGGKRALKLFGVTKQYNKLTTTITNKVKAIPSTEEMYDNAKKFAANAKSDVEEKIEDMSEIIKEGKITEILKFGKDEEIAKKVTAKSKAVKTVAKKAVAKAKSAKKSATQTIKAKTPAAAKAITKKATKAKTTAKKSTKAIVAKTVKTATPKKATKVSVKTKATPVAKKTAVVKAKSATATKAAPKVAVSELTKIKGIGASLAAIMTDNGIKTIKDLQNATPTALQIIAVKAGNRYKSFNTNNWITAAKSIAK